MAKRGRKKITDQNHLASRQKRFTFSVDPKIVMKFKAIAALKKMTIDELGSLTVKELIKKEKSALKEGRQYFDEYNY